MSSFKIPDISNDELPERAGKQNVYVGLRDAYYLTPNRTCFFLRI